MYKEAHEKFVSDLGGTSIGEIALVVSCAPLSVLLRNILLYSWFGDSLVNTKWLKFVFDFTMLVVPGLLSVTIFADHLLALLTGMLCVSLGVVMFYEQVLRNGKKAVTTFSTLLEEDLPGEKRPFVSAYRAYVNIATAVSILAVDFVIYPRRFAKAETFGCGLMDAGVGAFIISNAIVSAEARGKHTPNGSLAKRFHSIYRACKGSSPLIILGLARLVTTKTADYQEHVTEYGVHWNFFFTLAVVKVLSTSILCFLSPSSSVVLALVIGGGYEYALTKWRLKDIIISGFDGTDSREGVLDANREGIFSSIGYLSLYFAGVVIGRYLFKKRSSLREWLNCLFTLFVLTQGCYMLLFHTETSIDRISRRMANLSFIIWMVAYNLQLLTSFCLAEVIVHTCQKLNYINDLPQKGSPPADSTCLLESVNRNGLLYFLLANVMTGLVNLSMETIYATPPVGFSIVLMYMFILSGTVFYLHLKDITTRFW